MLKIPRAVRFTIFLLVAASVVTLLILGALRLFSGPNGAIAEGATTLVKPDETVRPFSENFYIASDGVRLSCYDKKNALKWDFGGDALEKNFECSDSLVVVWWGANLRILDVTGGVKYNETLKGDISLARCGTRLAAVYIPGQEKEIIVYSLDQGMQLDAQSLGGKALLDFGFYAEDSLWILLLDTSGASPVTTLTTIRPADSDTGGHSFNEVAYRVFDGPNGLNVVGSRDVTVITNGDAQPGPTLVYGWQAIDHQKTRDGVSILFSLSSEAVAGTPSRLKLVTNGAAVTEKELHLPGGCMAAFVGTKYVYGIASNAIHAVSLDGSVTQQFALPETVTGITKVIAKLSGNRILVETGRETRVLDLPV